MKIIEKCLNANEFKDYIKTKYFGLLTPNKIVLHHTYIPNLKQWKGLKSILAIKKVYESKRWSTGPHLFIAPDGIWLFTDMSKNGTHAGKGNWLSIGIEVVGDYRFVKPTGIAWELTKFAITALNERLNLKIENIKFHRDYSNTECPGAAVEKEWVINELKEYVLLPLDRGFVKDATKNTVFFVNNMIKYPIPDWETFMFYWGTPDKIINISNKLLTTLETGKILPSFKN